MATLRAFRPLRYNQARVGDLASVVAPPYDVISEARRDALYARSEYNVVRLILNGARDRYAAAGERLRAWCRAGVLVRERVPSLGYYVEQFSLPGGGTGQREGVIGVVRLEPFSSGNIRPHERTFTRAKEDRMRILRACRTNLSPIFGLFADKTELLEQTRLAAANRQPDIAVVDDGGVRHQLWLLEEPSVIEAVAGALRDEPILIADGHHRYETALAYRDAQRAQGCGDPDAPHNFILMYLTSMSHPGLVILPTHRVVTGGPAINGSALLAALRQHFHLIPFARSAQQEFRACLHGDSARVRLGIALADRESRFVATLADPSVLERCASNLAPAVRGLDVAVLDTVILRGLLGIDCSVAAQAGQLAYTHDDDEAVRTVDHGAQAAFLLNAPRIEDVQAVCLAGETMPEKSTYFYPKLLTGLVFHPLVESLPV